MTAAVGLHVPLPAPVPPTACARPTCVARYFPVAAPSGSMLYKRGRRHFLATGDGSLRLSQGAA